MYDVQYAAAPTSRGAGGLRVLFFGKVADGFGRFRDVTIPPQGCSIAELRRRLAELAPEGAAALGEAGVRCAVEHEIVVGERTVMPGQEVAFFSAFSGG